ncbi:MAG: hypothetical protein ABIO02_03390, partial [Patescibacteria group bacterium]
MPESDGEELMPLPGDHDVNPTNRPKWIYTVRAEQRVAQAFIDEGKPDGRLEKIGMFEGRKLIGRDRTIDKGVYITEGYGEAIVVDGDKYPSLRAEYEKLKKDLVKKASKQNQSVKSFVLQGVYDRTVDLLKYNQQAVEKINNNCGIP